MLRNHLCLRFVDSDLDGWLIDLFDNDEDIAKAYYRCDRSKIIDVLCLSQVPLVLKMMNVVFLINRIGNISDKISSKESSVIKNILDKLLKVTD